MLPITKNKKAIAELMINYLNAHIRGSWLTGTIALANKYIPDPVLLDKLNQIDCLVKETADYIKTKMEKPII